MKIAGTITGISVAESRRTKALIVIMVKNKARDDLEAEHYSTLTINKRFYVGSL
ncbi:MAG: hypothetical protein K2N72_11605 [Oscillospiraceae bacterium]|nr:hypothetical protein [Oscillospiraceae bacterium]